MGDESALRVLWVAILITSLGGHCDGCFEGDEHMRVYA